MNTILSMTHLTSVIDIAIVAALFWVGITWLKNTRARLALPGIIIVGVLYVLARRFELQLTTSILQGFFAAFVLVLIVVFQEDLRRLFEGITVWSFRRRAPRPSDAASAALVRTTTQLATAKIGALIVLPGREPLERHLEGGVDLHGRLSEPLLLSLFDPHSPGHDGAILVRGDTIIRFAVHLPLSTDWEKIGGGGTRHAAALGLAERCDALCIVVSEERGTISLARGGELLRLEHPEELNRGIADFIEQTGQSHRLSNKQPLGWRLAARWRDAMLATLLAAGIWYLFVPGTAITEVTKTIPISVENLPEGYRVEGIEPGEVEVTFSGRRRDLILANPNRFEIQLDGLLVQFGRRTFQITPEIIEHPDRLRIVSIYPKKIRLSVEKPPKEEAP